MTNEYTKEIDRLFETYGPDKKTILLFNGNREVFTWDDISSKKAKDKKPQTKD